MRFGDGIARGADERAPRGQDMGNVRRIHMFDKTRAEQLSRRFAEQEGGGGADDRQAAVGVDSEHNIGERIDERQIFGMSAGDFKLTGLDLRDIDPQPHRAASRRRFLVKLEPSSIGQLAHTTIAFTRKARDLIVEPIGIEVHARRRPRPAVFVGDTPECHADRVGPK